MKTKIVSLVMGMPCICPVQAQLLSAFRYPAHAMVGAYCPPAVNAFSFQGNPGSLTSMTAWNSGIYSEQGYALPELTRVSFAMALPFKSGGLGLVLHQAGSSKQLSTSQAGLVYAKKLGRVNLGGRFNYTAVRIPGYGGDAVFSFDIGTLWQITKKFCSGLLISNPQGARFGKMQGAKLPAMFVFGAGYTINDRLCIASEIIKEEEQPLNVQIEMQYNISSRFFASLCMSSFPAMPGFSFGWQRKNMRVCTTGRYHAQLGFTPGIALLFTGNSRKQHKGEE